jgi:hypothetical protein
MPLSALCSLETIRERLPSIFPDGTENRNYVIRGMAAKTIYVMLYVDAISGKDRWIRPDQVTKMTDEQAALIDDESRLEWVKASLVPGGMTDIPNRWYAANTREPIRDETLRSGLIQLGAVVERQGLATTSAKPRYALTESFAGLFDEGLAQEEIQAAVDTWQKSHLSAGALARIQLVKRGAGDGREGEILVTFPNGETRRMAPGPSSVISKAVIEEFAARFLHSPAVVFLSESANKVVSRDNELAAAIGLKIESDRNLPDIVLADLGPEHPLLVFVEVVATDGAVTPARKIALQEVASRGGFPPENLAFVTAFFDRSNPAYRKLVSEVAWESFVWFVSEPDKIVVLRGDEAKEIRKLVELL